MHSYIPELGTAYSFFGSSERDRVVPGVPNSLLAPLQLLRDPFSRAKNKEIRAKFSDQFSRAKNREIRSDFLINFQGLRIEKSGPIFRSIFEG